MKIPPSTPAVTGDRAAQPGDVGRAKGAPDKATVGSVGGASVHLSPLSTQLHALASSLSGPEFDRAKVDQIRQAISDGKLRINTEVVADRLIADAQDLAAAGKR
jgi:negative regulator of flagellin synthesis FlgM